MAHKTEAELREELARAAELVEVGAQYAHYKHPELPYLVTQIAVLEATDEPCVLYEAQAGAIAGITFVRPLSSFIESTEMEGLVLPRFKKID